MDGNDVFQMYEKHYFHEIESREKLNSRIQTPLTLIVSFVGVVAYLLQNYGGQGPPEVAAVFLGLLLLSFFVLLVAAYCLIRSWYNNTYEFLPSAEESETYHKVLLNHYSAYSGSEDLAMAAFANYLKSYYVKCASANALTNDTRTFYLHETSTALIATAAVAFVAFLVFFFGGLDKSNIKKPAEVSIVGTVRTVDEGIKKQETGNSSSYKLVAPVVPQQRQEGNTVDQPRRKQDAQ